MRAPRIPSLACALALSAAAQQWDVQYFYDNAKSTLVIRDIAFPSATRGVAVGAIVEGTKVKPVTLTTNDGGANWAQSPLGEEPVSLFFLNDSVGWFAGEKNVWKTMEGGRDWTKIGKTPAPPIRLYFWDEERGIAACAKKLVVETQNGGKKWTEIEASTRPAGAPERSAYTWIAFANPQYGLVSGYNQPLIRWSSMFPTWLDPEDALSRRALPQLSYNLSTNDGGKSWKAASASMLGTVSRFRFHPNGHGLGLKEYPDSFNWPAEVFAVNWKTGTSEVIFRDKRCAITDIWMSPEGVGYLAGFELQGTVRSVAPGQVRVFTSTDMRKWVEMKVDYRANAQHVNFAGSGEQMWLATDTGMILTLK
jgi:hypothetical protein